MNTFLQTTKENLLLTVLCAVGLCAESLLAQDTTLPSLISSSPAKGATGVALDAKVIFTFSEAMQASQSIFWNASGSGFDSGKFSYSWSADQKTLTCAYAGNLPAGASVNWFLVSFSDLADNMLAPEFGSFTTATGGGGTNQCPGVNGDGALTAFSLLKTATFVQTSAAAPVPDQSQDPYGFFSTVNLATNRTATDVTLTVPGGSPQPMMTFFDPRQYIFVDATNDQQKLDALYPAGSYAFDVSGSPSQNVTANLPLNAIPNAPHVSNYAAAQTINAGAAFTLAWDPFVGGTATDSITVQVLDASNQIVFQTENAGCPSALPGTALSIDIPARTLASNQTYTAQITFQKNATFDTNSYPGSVVFVAGESITRATIVTGSGVAPPPAPVFTNVVLSGSAQINFQLLTQAGHNYVVEFNSDLNNSSGWAQLLSSNAVGAVIQITDTITAGGGSRFYRAHGN